MVNVLPQLTGAEQDLLAATDADNLNPEVPTSGSQTMAAAVANGTNHKQLSLLIEDLLQDRERPIGKLRSDRTAASFKIWDDAEEINLLTGRMVVPSGPWPGHYGLEFISFCAQPACFPEWFPTVGAGLNLHTAKSRAMSKGFRGGQGAVMFPELLAARQRVRSQSFGVVFTDRLIDLYHSQTVPILELAGLTAYLQHPIDQQLRTQAFLAHEWGHLTSPAPYNLDQVVDDRRLAAVIGEIHADAAALQMLAEVGTEQSAAVAAALIGDRVGREAWLPRANRQVNSIAGRHLLRFLLRNGILEDAADGSAARVFGVQVVHLRIIEEALIRGDVAPARHFLRDSGWTIDNGMYTLDQECQLEIRLRSAYAS